MAHKDKTIATLWREYRELVLPNLRENMPAYLAMKNVFYSGWFDALTYVKVASSHSKSAEEFSALFDLRMAEATEFMESELKRMGAENGM